MYFYDKNGNYAGAVWIYFSTEIQNNLGWYKNYIPFSVTLSVPVEVQRIWTIAYNCVELIVVIHCNEVQSNEYVYFYNQDGNYTASVYIYTQEP